MQIYARLEKQCPTRNPTKNPMDKYASNGDKCKAHQVPYKHLTGAKGDLLTSFTFDSTVHHWNKYKCQNITFIYLFFGLGMKNILTDLCLDYHLNEEQVMHIKGYFQCIQCHSKCQVLTIYTFPQSVNYLVLKQSLLCCSRLNVPHNL